MVEAIRDGVVRDAVTVADYHGRMHEELLYLDRLIDELFDLSRFESGSSELDTVSVNLYELVTETIEGSARLQLKRDGPEYGGGTGTVPGSARSDPDAAGGHQPYPQCNPLHPPGGLYE
jgi:signal transduction histidine kinase